MLTGDAARLDHHAVQKSRSSRRRIHYYTYRVAGYAKRSPLCVPHTALLSSLRESMIDPSHATHPCPKGIECMQKDVSTLYKSSIRILATLYTLHDCRTVR